MTGCDGGDQEFRRRLQDCRLLVCKIMGEAVGKMQDIAGYLAISHKERKTQGRLAGLN